MSCPSSAPKGSTDITGQPLNPTRLFGATDPSNGGCPVLSRNIGTPFSVDGIGGQPQQTPTGTTASETGTFPKGEGQPSDNTDNCDRQTTQKGSPLPCGRNSLQTEFKVGSSVALADPYTVAYSYHGKVESVFGNEAVVRWAERRGQPNECENYKLFVLRLLEEGR